jgi:hypothetical protein
MLFPATRLHQLLPSSHTSSCHLFLGLPLGLVDLKFIYNAQLGILFSFILCRCPNQHNLWSLIVSYGTFFNNCINILVVSLVIKF